MFDSYLSSLLLAKYRTGHWTRLSSCRMPCDMVGDCEEDERMERDRETSLRWSGRDDRVLRQIRHPEKAEGLPTGRSGERDQGNRVESRGWTEDVA